MSEMNWKGKFAIGSGIVLVISALVFIIWYQRQTIERQRVLESQIVEMKKLQDGTVRAQASYVSKDDLNKFAKNNTLDLGPIREDLKALNAEIKGINRVVVVTPGYTGTNLPSTTTQPRAPSEAPAPVTVKCPDGSTQLCPDADKFGYTKNAQELKLVEPFGGKTNVPWGSVKFSAWREKPWDLTVSPREYTSYTVLSTDESGRHFVHNKLEIKSEGKSHVIPVENAQFVEQYPESSLRWDPSLYLGVDAGPMFNPVYAEVTPNMQLFLLSYGRTKVNPDWIFLGIGAGYETQANRLGFLLSPVSYNLGKVVPIIDNFYIGPSVAVDATGNVGLLGGVRVGL